MSSLENALFNNPSGQDRHEYIVRELRGLRRAPDQARIYTAGEKEYYNAQRVQADGVEITPGVQRALDALRRELDLSGRDLGF